MHLFIQYFDWWGLIDVKLSYHYISHDLEYILQGLERAELGFNYQLVRKPQLYRRLSVDLL